MSNPFTPFLIRVFDNDDARIGGGFLVTNRHAITCAHIVADALSIDRFMNEVPAGEISLDFPLSSQSQKLKARVVHWIPMKSGNGQPMGDEDIALLEIQDTLPIDSQAASLVNEDVISGTKFTGFGFGLENGMEIEGQTQHSIVGGCVPLVKENQVGFFFTDGYSGTPVLEKKTNSVIGMLVRVEQPDDYADEGLVIRTAYMIPSSLLTMAISGVVDKPAPESKEEEHSDSVSHPFWETFKSLSDTRRVRYEELAIFPDGTEIPLATLIKLWRKTGTLSEYETITLCKQLRDRSLLQLKDEDKLSTIRLPSQFRRYLIEKDNDDRRNPYHQPRLPSIHQDFLYAHKQSDQNWSELPEDDSYCWDHLAFHLKEAERLDDLIEIISDWRYLTKKIRLRGLAGIESDLLVAEEVIEGKDSKLRTARLIYKNFGNLFENWVKTKVKQFAEINQLSDIASLLQSEIKGGSQYLILKFELPDSLSNVRSCRFSHDGKKIVTTSDDGSLTVWEADSGRLLYLLRGNSIYDPKLGRKRVVVDGHEEEVQDCDFGTASKSIVSASADCTLKIWVVEDRDVINTLQGHKDVINACCFSYDGRWIVSASDDCTIKVWDVESNQSPRTFNHAHPVKSCVFGKDVNQVISATADGVLTTWNIEAEKMARAFIAHSSPINRCSYFDRKVVIAFEDGTLGIWKADSIDRQPLQTFVGHSSAINGCCFSTEGKLVVSASSDETVKVWDIATGRCRAAFYADGPMYCCAMHEDLIVAGGARGVYFFQLLRSS